MDTVKKKRKSAHLAMKENNVQMSTKTMDFIQKICYKQAPTVDMTKFGFISDSKLQPITLLFKPLRTQLEKIIGDKVSPMPILKQPSSQMKRNAKRAVKFNIKGHSNQSSTHSTASNRKQAPINTKTK